MFLLRDNTSAWVFANPGKVYRTLHDSLLDKYLQEGETHSLSSGSALIVVVWQYNVSKVSELVLSSFPLGEEVLRRIDLAHSVNDSLSTSTIQMDKDSDLQVADDPCLTIWQWDMDTEHRSEEANWCLW